RAEGPALDRLGEDDRRGADVRRGSLVRREDLAVVVATASKPGEIVIREALDELAEARIRPEEVLPDVCPAGDRELLELAIEGVVHLFDEDAVHVASQELVPLAA